MADGSNIVKVRDDCEPIYFSKCDDPEVFKVVSGQSPDWAPAGNFGIADLRSRVEPWLTSLFQSEHLSLLVGSGLTTAIQYDACGGGSNGMGDFKPKSRYAKQIISKTAESAKAVGKSLTSRITSAL